MIAIQRIATGVSGSWGKNSRDWTGNSPSGRLNKYKEDELKRLDGMFSFILLDDDQLIFSRDWIGKIPLFFSESNKLYDPFQIRIGSELKSIYTDETSSYRIVPKNSLVKINLSTKKKEIVRTKARMK